MRFETRLIDTVILGLIMAGQVSVFLSTRRALRGRLRGPWAGIAAVALALLLGASLAVLWTDNVGLRWSGPQPGLVSRAVSFGAGIWIAGWAGAAAVLLAGWGIGAGTSPERRQLVRAASRAAALAPFAAAGYGTLIVRDRFELREVDFPLAHLPPALDGLRLVLLTDIHFGPYLSGPELDRVIAMANETRSHVALITGDLITQRGDPLEACLERLAALRAEAGVFGCLGNHEIYARAEHFAELRGRSLGIEFLRQRTRSLDFSGTRLNLAGVDYQRQRRPYLVGAGELLQPGAVNLLLSHNPDVFPVAAGLGYDLVVGGHTHGGQVTVEILEQWANIGRFYTPFVAGLYRRGRSSLYVSRGIGTINLPMRLGARPEVTLLRLRRA